MGNLHFLIGSPPPSLATCAFRRVQPGNLVVTYPVPWIAPHDPSMPKAGRHRSFRGERIVLQALWCSANNAYGTTSPAVVWFAHWSLRATRPHPWQTVSLTASGACNWPGRSDIWSRPLRRYDRLQQMTTGGAPH